MSFDSGLYNAITTAETHRTFIKLKSKAQYHTSTNSSCPAVHDPPNALKNAGKVKK